MLTRLDRIASETLGALHRDSIDDPNQIRRVFEHAATEGSILDAGIDSRNKPRRASIARVNAESLLLASTNLSADSSRQFYFRLEVRGGLYFFAAEVSTVGGEMLSCRLPSTLYRAERRDIERSSEGGISASVAPIGEKLSPTLDVELVDRSLHGAAVRIESEPAAMLPDRLLVRIDGDPRELYASVRHRTPDAGNPGWLRIGLSISSVPTGKPIHVDRRSRLVSQSLAMQSLRGLAEYGLHRARRRAGFGNRHATRVQVVRFANSDGRELRGIVNGWGDPDGATSVVIPPAWGRTKETLMPLALTIVETFKRARQPIQVLRYDGTNRRGESHIDPECRRPGDEYLHFRFSQAARDVESAFQFVRSKSATPSKAILVTFSLAAVEGRHAMATSQRPADGWVAVVGVADLQSALRTISGGVDYGYGLLRGVRFGRHELVGVVADMDLTGLDAIQHGIGFLEDARRDMARISAPITWIHGRYDAWMDLDRVAEIMSCGDTSARKLIEVPTGHQLRSSQAALATFRLISEEVSEMALGRRVQGAAPSVSRISNTRDAEMARRPKRSPNVRTFWEDYLLGRDRSLGMQLLTATAQYRNFFESQVRLLGIHDSCRIADLGSGTGEFALGVCGPSVPKGLEVVEVDFVISALRRGARRRERDEKSSATSVRQCAANLDVSRGSFVPLQDGSVDAVLASLIVSYVGSPERLMREAFRILRPGGRFVVSSMLEDADVSMLFHDGLLEYATAEARHGLTDASDDEFDRMVRDFLNDGSRLLDMEEDGTFKFWGEEDLRHAVANAGFARISSALGLGSPPQAVVVRAVKP